MAAAANSVRIASLLSLWLVICSGNRVGLSTMDGEANDGSINLNEGNNISGSAHGAGNSASSMGLGPCTGYNDYGCQPLYCHKPVIGVGFGGGCNTDCGIYTGCDRHTGYGGGNIDSGNGFDPCCYFPRDFAPATIAELTQKVKELTMKLDAQGLGKNSPMNMDAMAPESGR